MSDVGWMFAGIALLTTSGYQRTPFSWGGSLNSIKWKGNLDQRVAALEDARLAFAPYQWFERGTMWSAEANEAYAKLLSTFYAVDAIRLLACAHGIDTGTGEAPTVIQRLLAVQVPLSSPEYLAAYANKVRKVASGSCEGGAAYTFSEADIPSVRQTVPPFQNAAGPGPAGVGEENNSPAAVVVNPQQALQTLLLSNDGSSNNAVMLEMLAMMQKQHQSLVAVAMNNNGPRDIAPVITLKAKTGWNKVLAEVKAALVEGSVPSVLKLSRVNRERLVREQTSSSDTRRVMLGGTGGAEILLPGQNTDKTTKSNATSDATWSGLSAFFRLFQIMATLTEDEFPRAKLADFFAFWTELWDSPRGKHTEKIKACVTFYEKYADELGSGTWKRRFDTDSRFLLEALSGEVPALCSQCGGCGESSKKAQGDRASGQKSERSNGTKNKRDRKPNGYCMSMIDQSSTCSETGCAFKHSPCPSCQGKCESAAKCGAWDQKVMDSKYSAIIAGVKRGGHKKRH
jgi:hypothetical protein